ncbi:MAG: DUF2239 family protein [Gammaproteobacteria bacterium]|nr:DUF2239 family protein [Gammaproteobacteria bacterium]
MNWHTRTPTIAFHGYTRIAAGNLREVASACRLYLNTTADATLLLLNAVSSEQIEVDFRGSPAEVAGRLQEASVAPEEVIEDEQSAPSGPGRPRLGVVAREVTLLPRHWEWLKTQPGGASVALRKLVENARRESADKDQQRAAQNSAYRFISIVASSLPGFEEASRALFAADAAGFQRETEKWPVDVRNHARSLVCQWLEQRDGASGGDTP